VRQKKKFK